MELDINALTESYHQRTPILEKVADEIRISLKECLEGTPHIDDVKVRVKSVDSFIGKVKKKVYVNPLAEMQDQIGVRVIVFYSSDIDAVKNKIESEFNHNENIDKSNEMQSNQFGYNATHYVCYVPPDIKARCNSPLDFFEIQISTMFQHAWSEANHDLIYKGIEPVSKIVERKVAWLAAQAWGADQIFEELRKDLIRDD